MTLWSYMYRLLKRYILSTESFLFLVLLVIIYNTVVNFTPLWERAKSKLRVTSPQVVNNVIAAQKSNTKFEWVAADPVKASWEHKSDHVAVYSIQGRRPHMEDRFSIHNNGTKLSMYGIFDGHGGELVAEYAQEHLFPMIVKNLKEDLTDLEHHKEVLTQQILQVDDQLLKLVRQKYDISGSTALVAMVTDTTLMVANVGDSRGVMCDKDGNTVPLSHDHKPNQVKEHQRIKDAGGFVAFNGVWRVAGILATSRALGDYPLKEKQFIIANPDIETFNLHETQPQFIILATDGLWDTFTNEDAVEYIKERLDEPHFGAKSILLQAYYKGSLDNITVMVVKFDKKLFEKKTS